MYLWLVGALFLLASADQVTGANATDKNDTQCDFGYEPFGDKCYYFSCETCKKTFYEALTYCRAENGDLASIHSIEEHTFLGNKSENFFIGLQYKGANNTFAWSDKSPVSFKKTVDRFEYWHPYFGVCARWVKGYWRNAVCTRSYRWVCKKQMKGLPNTMCPKSDTDPLLDSGTVFSPGYPSKYHVGDATCEYHMVVKVGNLVKLIFNATDLYYNINAPDFDEDRIDIFDGVDPDEMFPIGSVTAVNASGTVVRTTYSNEVTLRFHSKKSHTGSWDVKWEPEPDLRARYVEAVRSRYSIFNPSIKTIAMPPVMLSTSIPETTNGNSQDDKKALGLTTVAVLEPVISSITTGNPNKEKSAATETVKKLASTLYPTTTNPPPTTQEGVTIEFV